MSLQRVRKRDGREVPLDPGKIESAVFKAMVAAGEEDAPFAAEVAEVVVLALEHDFDAPGADGRTAVPGIEEIQDRVERALIELGRAPVAKAYILYRDRRARIREALEVHRPPAESRIARRDLLESLDGPRSAAAQAAGESPEIVEQNARDLRRRLRSVRVQESQGASSWSKGRIVAALMNEANVSRRLAEDVAASVELRVFDAGLRRISTSLIRELVDNELVAMGLDSALRRQGLIGVPRHDLRLTLEQGDTGPGETRAVEERVAGELLRRYALEEVFDERVCERHLSGDLEVVDLARPHRHLATAVPAELLLTGEPSVAAGFQALGELAPLLRTTTARIVLTDTLAMLRPLVRGGRGSGDASLRSWLHAAAATARAAGGRIDLGSPGPRGLPLLARLIAALAEMGEVPGGVRLWIDGPDLDALLESGGGVREADVERLLSSGQLRVTWGRGEERFAAPGCRRLARERAAVACGGAVALNLPRLAWRAGPWREDRMLELLQELIEDSLVALESLSVFQERHRRSRPHELRGRVGFALVPVGLREALKLLGDGEVRPEQGARLLGFCSDAARRRGAERHLTVALSPFFGGRAARRFAELDAALPQQAQRLLFDEGVGAGLDRTSPYSEGYALSSDAEGVGRDEALALATVPSGALHPFPRASAGRVQAIEVWDRFRALRYPHLFADDEAAGHADAGGAHEAPLGRPLPGLVDEIDEGDTARDGTKRAAAPAAEGLKA